MTQRESRESSELAKALKLFQDTRAPPPSPELTMNESA